MAVTKAKRNTTPKSVPTPIVRDNTFSRAAVDKTLVVDLGRDMEIACFQVGPEIVHLNNTAKGEEFDAATVLTEVVRLRLPWSSGVQLAMSILQPAVAKGMIDIDGFIKALDAMRVKTQTRSQKKVSSGAE